MARGLVAEVDARSLSTFEGMVGLLRLMMGCSRASTVGGGRSV